MAAKEKGQEKASGPDGTRQTSQRPAIIVGSAIGTVLGIVLTFVKVIELSLPLKFLLAGGIVILYVLFDILVRRKKRLVEDFLPMGPQVVTTVRATAAGVVVVILLAAGIRQLENWLKGPEIGAASVYYMIVLDASETMNSPFDGHPSKWSAVQSAFKDFLAYSNERSNYGLVTIGGQNPNETSSNPCLAPTVPLIPLVSRDGRAFSQADLSLANLRTEFERQQPKGAGSLRQAFFLAKKQLETLPRDKIKIIVLMTSSSDVCEGAVDWDKLANDIQLADKAIAIHKELVLLDEMADPKIADFMQQVNQPDQPGDSYTFVHVVHNYYELTLSINTILNHLNPENAPTQMASATGNPAIRFTTSPGLDQEAEATRIKKTTEAPVTAQLTTIVPSGCVVVDIHTVPESTLTAAAPMSVNFCTATSTVTPLITATPTYTLVPRVITYVPVTPTKRKQDAPAATNAPAATDAPPPANTEDPCCKHCGTTSQPCGDSCISLEYTCSEPPGCACP